MAHTTILVVVLAGLSNQPHDDAGFGLRRIDVLLKRTGHGMSYRIEARISNPNRFPVFNMVADCTFRDRGGFVVASNKVTIVDAVQANQTRRIPELYIGEWPLQAWSAACVSVNAQQMPE